MGSAAITKQRILDAATKEFARHGIAGARIDRIAARSGMSKPMIYTYFDSKQRLFDAVFDTHVLANSDRVPFSADDLPGYAARLYDDYLADPALLRLVLWKRLELEPEGYLFAGHEGIDRRHLAKIADAQTRGVVRADLEPEDVWSIVLATAATWGQNSIAGVATAADPSTRHATRREALVKTIRDGLRVRPAGDDAASGGVRATSTGPQHGAGSRCS